MWKKSHPWCEDVDPTAKMQITIQSSSQSWRNSRPQCEGLNPSAKVQNTIQSSLQLWRNYHPECEVINAKMQSTIQNRSQLWRNTHHPWCKCVIPEFESAEYNPEQFTTVKNSTPLVWRRQTQVWNCKETIVEKFPTLVWISQAQLQKCRGKHLIVLQQPPMEFSCCSPESIYINTTAQSFHVQTYSALEIKPKM